MEKRINYLERRIEELLVRVSELEKQSAPAGTDAESFLNSISNNGTNSEVEVATNQILLRIDR